ncbi:uncharacterized protein LOC135099426 [Scylla paramamosain]|uniref:uncharacterized protein LOC135099426 n=1 Tax=Scylla paramamosain TaxID=85552 RepID=UPI003083C902
MIGMAGQLSGRAPGGLRQLLGGTGVGWLGPVEIPEDLFINIVVQQLPCLCTQRSLHQHQGQLRQPALVLKAQHFKDHLSAKFEWDLTLGDERVHAGGG